MCVGGKCDGCVNLALDEEGESPNKGLQPAVDALESIQNNPKVEPFMTRADLWAYAGVVAVERGIRLSNREYDRIRK